MLPRIDPTSDALTTSCSPSPSANRAMISSGAFPNVTLSSPPMPGPDRAASSSVARPISAAVGITPSAEAKNTSAASASANRSTTAIGMNGTRTYGHPSPLSRKRRRLKEACAWLTGLIMSGRPLRRQQVRALADLGVVAVRFLDALRVLLQVLLGRSTARDRKSV